MMRIATAAALASASLLVMPALARAEERTLDLDPGSTVVRFDVEATGHDVHGSFKLTSGRVRFDPETGAATGEIRVDALSAVTGNGSRDRTLRGDVLEVERFPLFVFTPERVVGTLPEAGDGAIELRGVVEIHGEAHPVTLPSRVHVEGTRLRLAADFPVPYVEWGLHNPGFLFLRVADVVTVHVEGAGTLSAETVAAADAR
jgi:polyisoprenoid-binding protein YceI